MTAAQVHRVGLGGLRIPLTLDSGPEMFSMPEVHRFSRDDNPGGSMPVNWISTGTSLLEMWSKRKLTWEGPLAENERPAEG